MSEQVVDREWASSSASSGLGFDGGTVGDMGRLFGLTHRAIRFYEERGLITPTRDRSNRRCFSREDRTRLQVIAMLRDGGLRLEEIRAVLSAPNFEARALAASLLAERIERLRRELNSASLTLERMTSSDFL